MVQAAISQEDWRNILNQIESDLEKSEIYQQVLTAIQSVLSISPLVEQVSAQKTDVLLKAVAREAIRLSVQKLTNQKIKISSGQNSSNSAPQIEENKAQNHQKNTSSKQSLSISLPEWEHRLRNIGKQIKQARLAKCLTSRQLHNLSFVLPNYIHCWETGQVELLPKDYLAVKEMVIKLSKALDLDTQAILTYLHSPSAQNQVKQKPKSSGQNIVNKDDNLKPIHLYIGSAAVMAGAFSGLISASQQQATLPEVVDHNSGVSISESSKSYTKIEANYTDISPPEMIN